MVETGNFSGYATHGVQVNGLEIGLINLNFGQMILRKNSGGLMRMMVSFSLMLLIIFSNIRTHLLVLLLEKIVTVQ